MANENDTSAFNEIQDWVTGVHLDVELLIDVSGSMQQENRVAEALEFANTAANVGTIVDQNGAIELAFFSDYPTDQSWEDVKPADIQSKFDGIQIGGTTDTLKFITHYVDQHYERKAAKADQRTIILCVTDGEPNGGPQGKKAIKEYLAALQTKIDFTQKVPELKVFFYQVGTDAAASAWLDDLDNDNTACGKLVYTVHAKNKDQRSIAELFRDSLREHLNP